MIELVHSSAPRGLFDDRGGYTTVACSGGAPRQLAVDLATGSTASVHRIAANVDPEPHAVYRLWSLRGDYGEFLVATRIVPVPADHTGRPARLAHHLAIPAAEASPASIGALLADPEAFRSTWDAGEAYLPPRPMPADAVGVPPDAADLLERLSQHSQEWGAHLADVASRFAERPQLLIVPDGTPMRLVLAGIAAHGTPGRPIRAETSCDHLTDARPGLLVLQPSTERPAALVPLADWSQGRGYMRPLARNPDAPRPAAVRQATGPDLSGLQAPDAAPAAAVQGRGSRLELSLRAFAVGEAPTSQDSDRTGTWLALAVYAIGALIGGAGAIVIANAAGLGNHAP